MAKNEEVAEPAVPATSFKQKCYKCLKGPNLIRTIVVLLCSVVVIQQITACVGKLINIPITTHTHFDFNETLMYPSLTFCREPPYKFFKMEEYGLYSHPRFTSVWRNFNFSHVSLDYLWDEITYTSDEFFVQYGFDGLMENVEVESRLGFVQGRCHTLTPRVVTNKASRNSGYSLTLRHSASDIANSISTTPPGYHVYVHYTKEPFTEVAVNNGGQIDYLYVNTGETIDVKLTVDQYKKISRDRDPCVDWENYSTNKCTTKYVSDLVGSVAGCSGPWMISKLPPCDNYNDMRNLIAEYMNVYDDHNGSTCPRICKSYLYNSFVTFRRSDYTWDSATKLWALTHGDAMLETHLYFHFNTMMVSVYEERYNYDWNLFLSDLGGSICPERLRDAFDYPGIPSSDNDMVIMESPQEYTEKDTTNGLNGFLLGLSVIGLLSMIGKLWETVQPHFKSRIKSAHSTATADIKVISKDLASDLDYLKKCQEWNTKNDPYTYT